MAKRGTLDNKKTKRLARQLGTIPGVAYGLLQTLWDWVGEYQRDGGLTRLDISDALDSGKWLDMFEVDDVIAAMTSDHGECILLDPLPDGRFYIHDWHEHSDDAVDNSLARAGARYANGTAPRMRRLSDAEKTKLYAQFPTLCEPVRTESHAVPLTSPVPEPVPVPDPVPVTEPPLLATLVPPAGGPPEKSTKFVKPSADDVAQFFKSNGSTGAEARKFWLNKEANGWKQGNTPLKNWQASALRWIEDPAGYSRAGPSNGKSPPDSQTVIADAKRILSVVQPKND